MYTHPTNGHYIDTQENLGLDVLFEEKDEENIKLENSTNLVDPDENQSENNTPIERSDIIALRKKNSELLHELLVRSKENLKHLQDVEARSAKNNSDVKYIDVKDKESSKLTESMKTEKSQNSSDIENIIDLYSEYNSFDTENSNKNTQGSNKNNTN